MMTLDAAAVGDVVVVVVRSGGNPSPPHPAAKRIARPKIPIQNFIARLSMALTLLGSRVISTERYAPEGTGGSARHV
jgi:hypothetical protein